MKIKMNTQFINHKELKDLIGKQWVRHEKTIYKTIGCGTPITHYGGNKIEPDYESYTEVPDGEIIWYKKSGESILENRLKTSPSTIKQAFVLSIPLFLLSRESEESISESECDDLSIRNRYDDYNRVILEHVENNYPEFERNFSKNLFQYAEFLNVVTPYLIAGGSLGIITAFLLYK